VWSYLVCLWFLCPLVRLIVLFEIRYAITAKQCFIFIFIFICLERSLMTWWVLMQVCKYIALSVFFFPYILSMFYVTSVCMKLSQQVTWWSGYSNRAELDLSNGWNLILMRQSLSLGREGWNVSWLFQLGNLILPSSG
jgi:hypothetical protein